MPDATTGLLKITPAQYDALQALHFLIDGKTYSLNANAQIWPRPLNSVIGGEADGIYLVISDLGTKLGAGMDFISGMAFLYVFPCITAVIWDLR